jgi:hypothetical protein
MLANKASGVTQGPSFLFQRWYRAFAAMVNTLPGARVENGDLALLKI